MKNTSKVDFSLFQFDRDLTFAVFFMNADETIYGRFGTRAANSRHQNVVCSIEPSPFSFLGSDVTLSAFKKAVEAALEIHVDYSPANEALKNNLSGKTGPPMIWKNANSLPALQKWRKRTDTLSYSRVNGNDCIHCHNFLTGRLESLRKFNIPISDRLIWCYPMPDVLGLTLDPKYRATVRAVGSGSEAEQAGFEAGDKILSMNKQPIISTADVQWVLHHAPEGGEISVGVDRGGMPLEMKLAVPRGWRRRDQSPGG